MILRQLQHHRSRVPAIPPRVSPLTLTWSFENAERGDCPPVEWKSFLSHCNLDPNIPTSVITNGSATLIRIMMEQGCKLTIKSDWPPGAYFPQIKLTVTRPARISPKLLATFPWKLRKQQLQPKGL